MKLPGYASVLRTHCEPDNGERYEDTDDGTDAGTEETV